MSSSHIAIDTCGRTGERMNYMFKEIYFNPVNQDYWEKVGDKFRLIGSDYTEDNILGLVPLSEEEIKEVMRCVEE